MILVRVMGGLGNQLQQYALYQKLKKEGKEVKLDISWFTNQSVQEQMLAPRKLELQFFEGLPMEIASEEEVKSVLGRKFEEPEKLTDKLKRKISKSFSPVFTEEGMYHPEIFDFDHKYLVGYFACEKYYADILKDIRQMIVFPQSTNHKNIALAQELETKESVSVHIRRGDYLDEANRAMFGNICTDAYYRSAIDYIATKKPDAEFYLFSDDPDYVRATYQGERFHVVDWNHGDDSFYDMQLMSLCKHNICANSTFSFWGARLNAHDEKMMVRPSIHKNTQVCVPEVMLDLWKGWVLVTPDGTVLSD